MRLPVPRATALFALLLTALVAAGSITSARTGPPGRDRAVRVTRPGTQRLETPDGPVHGHEEIDPVHVPAADVIGLTPRRESGPGTAATHARRSTSVSPTARTHRITPVPGLEAAAVSLTQPDPVITLARVAPGDLLTDAVWHPAAGRAPPAA